jgi:hypothetical protein
MILLPLNEGYNMKLKALQLNTIFDYIKDTRRYVYDIEESIKEYFKSTVIVLASHPIPDEIEPEIPRFTCMIEEKDYTIQVAISQVRLTTVIEYKNKDISQVKIEIENLKAKTKAIKDIIAEKIKNFNILFEGIILVSENISSNISEMKYFEDIDVFDEKRTKDTMKYGSDYFLTKEKIFLRAFQANNSNITILNKNIDENFAGYYETYILEINNREKYNRESGTINNSINIDAIQEKLIEEVSK